MGSPVQFEEGTNSFASGRLSEPLDGDARAAGYGLRREALSPMETLGQSIATVGPSLTPVATIPLVGALAGNGTWLAYVLATIAILFVAWCIGRFARYTSSPGSLYSYVTMILPPWLGATAGWSLFLAYVATGASNIGGFYEYANVLLRDASGHMASTVLLSSAMAAVTMWFAWRDVKISARLMLSMEALSVTLIIVIVVLVLVRHGFHGDPEQLHLHGVTGSGLRLGLVLAIFSFAGFESATRS
jgi:amino acid transporter